VLELQRLVRRVPCADHVIAYATRLVRSTRVDKGEVPGFITDYVSWGAGPRASQNLVLTGKARAVLSGRYHVSTEDIRAVAHPVLRHRVLLNFNAEAEGVCSDDLITRLLEAVPVEAETAMDETTARRVFKS
jgi:MoxR-like ATPase